MVSKPVTVFSASNGTTGNMERLAGNLLSGTHEDKCRWAGMDTTGGAEDQWRTETAM